jgi:hypothetical protein
MPNIPEFHLDLLGRKIFPGDFVVSQSWGQSLGFFTVERLTEKMVKLKKIKSENWRSSQQRYPHDCVKVEGPEVTFFLLQNSKSS